MTSIAQVTALVDAHVSRDHTRFRAVTLQIAAHLAPRSEQGAAQLRKLVEKPQVSTFVPLPSAAGLLSAPPEMAAIDDMVLAPAVRERFDRIVLEYDQRAVLSSHRLLPARKLLFTGPPGVGKSMAAGALARAVSLPMFRVELHALIGSFMGETASKLSKVFDHIAAVPAVYLFDEFDAIGTDRSAQRDGSGSSAEMRRVVNSLLQLIEDDRSESLIIAATNHAQALDRALFRRFDEVVKFPLPSKAELIALLRRRLVSVDVDQLDIEAIYTATANPKLGHADVCAALDRVLKDNVLAGSPIDSSRVTDALVQRMRTGEGLLA